MDNVFAIKKFNPYVLLKIEDEYEFYRWLSELNAVEYGIASRGFNQWVGCYCVKLYYPNNIKLINGIKQVLIKHKEIAYTFLKTQTRYFIGFANVYNLYADILTQKEKKDLWNYCLKKYGWNDEYEQIINTKIDNDLIKTQIFLHEMRVENE